eukprot:TRINITY_DN3787_c3_g1_i1.p1 TRINITY_DN3787_c3_g1~~TRINITY_DN3787_c3_g1_i1.p1  ORF type:complete len:190 (+),score=17.64 TRINITY_DN3787_c3_g1_i1:120-689(+)
MSSVILPERFRRGLQSSKIQEVVRTTADHYEVPVCFIALHSESDMAIEVCVGIHLDAVPYGMCFHNTSRDLPIIIEDVSNTSRVQDDILVTGPPYCKFFASNRLAINSACIGSICILDTKPRSLSLDGCSSLHAAAAEIISSLMLDGVKELQEFQPIRRFAQPAEKSYPKQQLPRKAFQLENFGYHNYK